MSEPLALYDKTDDGVAILTLNRPDKLNALNQELQNEVESVLARIAGDMSVKVLVVMGKGRALCTGEDIHELRRRAEQIRTNPPVALPKWPSNLALKFRQLEIPIVTAVKGPCTGAGFGIVLVSDIKIADTSAYFFSAYLSRGVSPGAETWLLPRMIGLGKATEFILLGEKVDAETALQLGLVNRVVAPAELEQHALDVARRLATRPTLLTRLAKRLIRTGLESTLIANIEEAALARALARATTADAAEGVDAFLERREPKFA